MVKASNRYFPYSGLIHICVTSIFLFFIFLETAYYSRNYSKTYLEDTTGRKELKAGTEYASTVTHSRGY